MSYLRKTGKTKIPASEKFSARVYNPIKHQILGDEFRPGQKLNRQQLSERLGVSRTAVRVALTRLVQEGYDSFLSKRGFTCKKIRMQEARGLYELGQSLDPSPGKKALEVLTDEASIHSKISFIPTASTWTSASRSDVRRLARLCPEIRSNRVRKEQRKGELWQQT